MAASLPYIATAISAYSAVKSAKTPKNLKDIEPKVIDRGDPDSLKKKINARRSAARQAGTGRAATMLTGSSSLG